MAMAMMSSKRKPPSMPPSQREAHTMMSVGNGSKSAVRFRLWVGTELEL